MFSTVSFFFFFFQAEDGIRDHCVTGVQTCALPISGAASVERGDGDVNPGYHAVGGSPPLHAAGRRYPHSRNASVAGLRSEERRVGKEWRSRWSTCQAKKKRENDANRTTDMRIELIE